MSRRQRARLGVALIVFIVGAVIDVVRPCIAGAYCTGDCDGNGTVAAGEFVDCRGIAFGSRPLSVCVPCDCDENGIVSDEEWMRAEQNALGGCNANECPASTATAGPSATGTPTQTAASPSRTPTTPRPTATTNPSSTPSTGATPTVIPGACVGDCDANGSVVVNEVVIGVNIALERSAVATCAAFDPNQTTTVSVSELVQGVNNLLRGCL